MKYKAIIFDLDGVICTTDKYHYIAWKQIADTLNVPFNEKINNRLRGVSRMESLEIILENYNRELSLSQKEDLTNRKNEIYVELLNNMNADSLSQEVKETLDYLRKKGYQLSIGSSSKNTKYILTRLGLADYFDAISDGTNISKSKPDPEVFEKAADFLNLAAKDCLVVEDAKAGIDAAINGGFDSAGLGEAANYEKTTYTLGSFKTLQLLLD